jgi:hypothetical protein
MYRAANRFQQRITFRIINKKPKFRFKPRIKQSESLKEIDKDLKNIDRIWRKRNAKTINAS